ncbi:MULTISPECIES: MATE family efflux transporter [Caproicibacterium]|uniref:MATE family efflux transporter n=1 Tax=Caproicibacterium argilliputei TaxID=3030016 RepID=A0AA97DAR7_9FIRM|nr:MATE family efflux transporter [Caproicibacterium argilliputei]WOC32185.1 MATE family efflux transporter [Caproicibacterium argilliputei]
MTKDLTHGSPIKLIFFFTIPLLIGNLFQQLYSMADTLIVGRTLGVDALAAVGCTGGITFLILGFAQGVTAGLSILTAQRFGAQDAAGVRKSFATGILFSAGVTVLLTAVSVPLARTILRLLNTPAEIEEQAYEFIVVILAGIVASMLFNLLSNIIRALGDSRTPLVFLVIASVLNIALDFLFILNFHMGVAGAGYATVIAQLVSCACCVIFIAKKLPILHLHRQDWHVTRQDFYAHARLALPMGFQSSIIAMGTLILQAALNGLGATAVASYTAASKVDQLAIQVMMSFGMTMATFAAQNYGAGKMDRIRKGVRQCLTVSILLSLVMTCINIFLGKYLVRLFVDNAAGVIDLAQVYLVINSSFYFILAVLFVIRYTLQGLGKSFVPTFAGIMELVMRTVAALALVGPFGFAGASASNPLAWLGSAVPLCIAYFVTMRRLPTGKDTA